jgi:hypothetical protein
MANMPRPRLLRASKSTTIKSKIVTVKIASGRKKVRLATFFRSMA